MNHLCFDVLKMECHKIVWPNVLTQVQKVCRNVGHAGHTQSTHAFVLRRRWATVNEKNCHGKLHH